MTILIIPNKNNDNYNFKCEFLLWQQQHNYNKTNIVRQRVVAKATCRQKNQTRVDMNCKDAKSAW